MRRSEHVIDLPEELCTKLSPRSVLPNVLHKRPGRGGDQWGEVCWWNYSRGKAKDKPEESYSTEQLLIKQQTKCRADHCDSLCRVNHRHKIHLMSHNERLWAYYWVQGKALRIITNSCTKISAPSSEIKANSRNYLKWNKNHKISLDLYTMHQIFSITRNSSLHNWKTYERHE